MQRRYWTQKEDQALKSVVENLNQINWTMVSVRLTMICPDYDRNAKQCRERWLNKLSRSQSLQNEWTSYDDKIILQQFLKCHGSEKKKWIIISQKMANGQASSSKDFMKNPNDIKNRFYSIVRKGVRRINNKLGRPIPPQEVRLMKPIITSKLLDQMDIQSRRNFLETIYNMSSDYPQMTPFSTETNNQILQKILDSIIGQSRKQEQARSQIKERQKPKQFLKKRKSSLSTIEEDKLQQLKNSENEKEGQKEKDRPLRYEDSDFIDKMLGIYVEDQSMSLQFEQVDFGI